MLLRLKRFYALTLVELFICIALLSMIGGLLLFKGIPMVQHYRFTKGVEELAQELLLTKKLSMAYKTDMTFHLQIEPSQIRCVRQFDETLPSTSRLLKKELIIKEVFKILYNGEEKKDQMTFFFSNSGWMEEKGYLELESGKERLFIVLPQFEVTMQLKNT